MPWFMSITWPGVLRAGPHHAGKPQRVLGGDAVANDRLYRPFLSALFPKDGECLPRVGAHASVDRAGREACPIKHDLHMKRV
jgi:hypothetical protein